MKHLGETFDIHGGGMDLIFPHHENEIAQSCGATGKEFARYWIHNGFVQINQEKMSKSLGNFFTIREIFAEIQNGRRLVTGEMLRYFLLSTHYRGPLDFSDQELAGSEECLEGFLRSCSRDWGSEKERPLRQRSSCTIIDRAARLAYRQAMDDDLQYPDGISGVAGTARRRSISCLDRGLSTKARKGAREEFRSTRSSPRIVSIGADNGSSSLKGKCCPVSDSFR